MANISLWVNNYAGRNQITVADAGQRRNHGRFVDRIDRLNMTTVVQHFN